MAPIPTLAPGECGYAYKKKPIVVYHTDFRKSGATDSTSYNLMLTESSNQVVDVSQDLDDDKKIARKLHQALMRLDPRIAVEA